MKNSQSMKISEKTFSLLKNFSTINKSLLFKPGNKIRTISVLNIVYAEATVEEEIPREFAIYDLNQFLNGISLHTNPELVFEGDDYVLITGGGNKTKYYFADPNIIVSPPDKPIRFPEAEVCFELSSDQLDKMIKASSIYQAYDLGVIGDGKDIRMVVRDKENPTHNQFSIDVGITESVFTFNFRVENIKIIPGKYNVVVSSKKQSMFKNQNMDLTYYIALETDSFYEG